MEEIKELFELITGVKTHNQSTRNSWIDEINECMERQESTNQQFFSLPFNKESKSLFFIKSSEVKDGVPLLCFARLNKKVL